MPPSLHLDTYTDWLAVQRPEAAIMAGPIQPQKKRTKGEKKKNRRNTTANCKEIDQTLLICQKKAP